MTGRLGATYRLQLGPTMGFEDAASLVEYLGSLGVECLYCSPVTEAVPGSTHGYDGTDPSSVRAELGGSKGFRHLAATLAAAGLGCLVDIVPNHMSTWPEGPWWREVLRDGPDSEFAELFDIDWAAGGNKVTLPLLDRPLAEAISSGAVTAASSARGERVLVIGDVTLPLNGGPIRPGEDLAEVLGAQWYRLVDWHDRRDRNYRRFFDIDGLVGVRVERPAVFERTHALVGELARAGLITALRVDHIDGLADPERYLRRLEELTGGVPVVVEKILTGDERLRRSWPVAGTTGYEVLDDIGGALADAAGLEQLAAAASAEGEPSVEQCTWTARRLVAENTFTAELGRVSAALGVDREALADATVRLPVYRTYLDGEDVEDLDPDDAAAIAIATAGHEDVREALSDQRRIVGTIAWQQVTGAVTAKGVEDTAWYRLPGRLAFCEVGGDPGRSRAGGVARLHSRASMRAASAQAGLVPSTTHDTKRSGDARARLYALSELAENFELGLARYRLLLDEAVGKGSARETVPARCSWQEVVREQSRTLAQTVLAVLPTRLLVGERRGPAGTSTAGDDELTRRVKGASVKSVREAGLRSSWSRPDIAYEQFVEGLVDVSLASGAHLVHEAFGEMVDEVARLGATTSLSSVLLRSALPGVPDCYQGDESWNLALVDPDNRRPVDFQALRRQTGLVGIDGANFVPVPGRAALLRARWPDGAVKTLVTAGCLHARRDAPRALSPVATHIAVEAIGPASSSLVAFARVPTPLDGVDRTVVAVATRLAGRLASAPGDLPACYRSYGATVLDVPPAVTGPFVDALTGRAIELHDGRLTVAEVLAELPVALLVQQ